MNLKEWLSDYFHFTRKERIGLFLIIFLILGVWISPRLMHTAQSQIVPADTSWIAAVQKLRHASTDGATSQRQHPNDVSRLDSANKYVPDADVSSRQLFYFDPNVLSTAGWERLGIRQKTITTIQKYVSKGGHFYKPEDLKKIYGIRESDYRRLERYIKIETSPPRSPENKQDEFAKKQSSHDSKYPIDVNAADTSAFIALPGIGNKLASRIVNFREKLGGFYSIDQVAETYGLPDSTFQKIKSFLKLETMSVKKININSASKEELKVHPYIRWALANAIVEYRNQHGNFSSLEDLKKISLVTDEIFNKLKSYLTL